MMRTGLNPFAEIYYENLLRIISRYEETKNVKFNKGMVYANLGISQIRNGKFQIGIAHLLTAEDEDKEINAIYFPDYDILNASLWQQFERQTLYPFLYRISQDKNARLGFSVNSSFLDRLFRSLDREDRIYIQGTIWDLIINLDQAKNIRLNPYTLGRLFSGLKDLSSIAETLLRKKQRTDGMLGYYLSKAVKNYKSSKSKSSSKSLVEFMEKIERNQAIGSHELRRLHTLHLVRNFTGHHFDVRDNPKTSQGNSFFFFELYDIALTHVIASIFYLKHIGAI